MTKKTAGMLLYRIRDGQLEVFLVHPGGPSWQRKDEGVWSILKGEFDVGADPLETAVPQFHRVPSTARYFCRGLAAMRLLIVPLGAISPSRFLQQGDIRLNRPEQPQG